MGALSAAGAIIRTLRPRQWIKNLFVAAPLVFAKLLTDVHAVLLAAAAVGAFCALSGAVYAVNDVADIDKDRAHPTKRFRPIAAGVLPVRWALVAAAVLAVGGLVVSAAISWKLGLVAAAYLAQNLLYSLRLKEVAFLDVLSLAAGFLLRVLAGAYAIDVPASPWLLVCTGLLAAFLGFGKRAHELGQAELFAANGGHQVGKTRAVLDRYDPANLRLALYALGFATSAAYVFYTRAPHTIAFFGTGRMIWTAPFCVLGIARFLQLVTHHARGDSPTDAMLRDWPFMANLALWGATVLAIIYFR